jgi:DNA repair protein RadC
MGYKRLAIGGRDSTVIDLDIIQCIASRLCAKKVILAHNHPGGSTRPSTADLLRTYELHSALKAQKKELVDHIIITADAHLSLKETGYFE